MVSKFRLISCLLSLAALVVPAVAAATDESSNRNKIIAEAFATAFGRQPQSDQIASNISHLFRVFDHDGNGIDEGELDLSEKIERAKWRGARLGQLLQYDLNGDFHVTRDEVRQVIIGSGRFARRTPDGQLDEKAKVQLERRIDSQMKDDGNGDGQITPAEFALIDIEHRNNRAGAAVWAGLVRTMLRYDKNDDGRLEEVEALVLLGEALQQEPEALVRKSRLKAMGIRDDCKLPAASEGVRLEVFSSLGGFGIPTATVAGQTGKTSIGDVDIEPGERPMYLILSASTPTIWRLSGAEERIVQVVAGGPANANGKIEAGVMGLPAERIAFVNGLRCLRFPAINSQEGSKELRDLVQALTGQPASAAQQMREFNELSLPSGKHMAPPGYTPIGATMITGDGVFRVVNGQPVKIETPIDPREEFDRRYPTGIYKVDAANVVSDAGAEPYEVLPDLAGIIQMLDSGALVKQPDGSIAIRSKIRMPAEVDWPIGTRLVLKKGVPPPSGDAKDVCLFSEDESRFLQQAYWCR